MDYLLNGTSYGGGSAVGDADKSKKGFVSRFDGTFLSDFAAGSSLTIYRGELLVDQLSLKGTTAGVAMVRRCMAALKANKAAAERERQRLAHIADDPFAVEQTEQEKLQFGANSAKPRSLPAAWVSDADYPSAAQRERRQGVTGYKLEVNADGQATSCIVTSSSGHADLDEATCRLLPRRARFSGSGVYESRVTWRLPE
ncbi:energy transducer TonB [Sphingobium sp. AS12]|nr:energy transducer TonB [Sphingobium sp. AS12]